MKKRHPTRASGLRAMRAAQAVLVAATVGICGAAWADGLAASDRDFIERAARGGQAELAGSALAQQRSTDPDVKAYAQQVQETQSRVLEALAQLGQAKGLTVPDSPSFVGAGKLAALVSEEGAAFDRAYAARFGVAAHRDALVLFQQAAHQTQDADVRAYVEERLPALQKQLDLARALQDKVDLKP